MRVDLYKTLGFQTEAQLGFC